MNKFDKLTTNIETIKASQEKKSGGGGKKDPRFLNYFELDIDKNQSMTVRFLPINDKGDVFHDYSIHSHPSRDVKNIQCSYTSSGDNCPVCSKSYAGYQAGDKATQKLWNKNEKTLAQVVVVQSDIDIDVAPDGNLIKLMYVPYGIKKEILKAIDNGIITNVSASNFVIKKAMGNGNRPHYDNSFYKPNDTAEIPQEFHDSYNADQSYIYDITKEAPPVTTTADMQAWLDVAELQTVSASTTVSKPTPSQDMDAILKAAEAGTKNSEPATKSVEPEVVVTPASKTNSDDLLAMLNNR